jgi:glycosyltransferase
MKEICIINYRSSASLYGVGTHINEYIFCLINLGCKINLIQLGSNNDSKGLYIREENNVRRIFIPYIAYDSFSTYNKGICRLLRLYINDSKNLIFHFHYIQSGNLLDCIKKYFPLSKSIYTIHYLTWSNELLGNVKLFEKIIQNQESEKINKQYGYIIESYKAEKIFFEKFDQIICLSDDTFKLVKNQYGIVNNIRIIPNGLRNKKRNVSEKQKIKIRKNLFIDPDENILLFVGRIDPIKGIDQLIVCFDELMKEFPNSRLVIVGSGAINDLLHKCKNSWAKLTLTGRIDKKTLYKLYSIADIAIFPSFYEECSYVGIEMLMYGLPIVASDGYNVKNMFHDGINSKIAKIENWNKNTPFGTNLKESIIHLMNDDKYKSQLKINAKKSYQSRYSIEYMQKGYLELLNSLQ